jgi:4-aminobutyrate aminotransferase/(S)-3-amino-2-methylpropionate transaminase
MDNAVKFARAFNNKKWIVSFTSAYHGRSYLGMALTGRQKPIREGFGPFMTHVRLLDCAYCYRCPLKLEYPSCALACTGLVEKAVSSRPLKDDVSCLTMEPIQGAGGFICPPPGYWERVKHICSEHSIVFIDDEIQTGFGRTGKLFGIQNWRVHPDLIATGKSLSMGLPIGAVTGRDEIMTAPARASLGSTYGGNPIACAGALEAIKLAKKALPNVKMIHGMERKRFDEWRSRFEAVGDVRGLGAMMCLEMVKTEEEKEPDRELTRNIMLNCFRNGLYLSTGGMFGNVVRTHPPLTIDKRLLETGLDIMESAIEEEIRKAR